MSRELAELTVLALEAGIPTTPEMRAGLLDYIFGCSWCNQDMRSGTDHASNCPFRLAADEEPES